MGRIVAVVNQKGGVGKTTTAVNLAACLAAAEKRVLLVDIDPQANASSGLGAGPQSMDASIYAALMQAPSKGHKTKVSGNKQTAQSAAALPLCLCRPTALPTLQLIASGPDLYAAEVELSGDAQRFCRLRDALSVLQHKYDVIIIDCPPSLGVLTLNALTAARSVLIPLQCEYYALEGLSQLTHTLKLVRRGANPTLRVEGILLTMFDRRNNLARQVAEDVRRNFGDLVYKTVIPRNVRLSEAPSFGKPVLLYDIGSTGCQSYIELAREFLSPKRRDRAAA